LIKRNTKTSSVISQHLTGGDSRLNSVGCFLFPSRKISYSFLKWWLFFFPLLHYFSLWNPFPCSFFSLAIWTRCYYLSIQQLFVFMATRKQNTDKTNWPLCCYCCFIFYFRLRLSSVSEHCASGTKDYTIHDFLKKKMSEKPNSYFHNLFSVADVIPVYLL
jgi:hypothetical protein